MAHNLLIVDDEEDIRSVLEDLFTSRGCEVTKATNGKEALDLLQGFTPDLILADYQMPEMDGIELFKEARSLYPDTTRILLTAHGDLKVAIAAINEAGVYRFITKPWNNNDLILTVQRALEHHDLIKENRAFADTLELMVDENTQEIERLRSELRKIAARIRSLLP